MISHFQMFLTAHNFQFPCFATHKGSVTDLGIGPRRENVYFFSYASKSELYVSPPFSPLALKLKTFGTQGFEGLRKSSMKNSLIMFIRIKMVKQKFSSKNQTFTIIDSGIIRGQQFQRTNRT